MRPALLVVPSIPDELDEAAKNGLALRNAASVAGVCPGCGALGELTADPTLEGLWHYTFRHESWCRALTDEAAA